MKNVKNYIVARLKEKTTWAIIFSTLATVFGINLAPELSEAITTIGLAVVALIGAGSTEQPK